MASVNHSYFEIADIAVSNIYNDKQSNILERMPNKISNSADIYEVKTNYRDKLKGAAYIYSTIKKNFLFKLDEMIEISEKDIQHIVNYLSEKRSKKDLEYTIKTTRKSRETINKLVILYDKFSWFKDPNLLSTIRLHERLNEFFLTRAEKSLKYELDKSQIKQAITELVAHPTYIKSLIVITFQPILCYGAIYASTKNDYEYILKYESVVSEAAEELFSDNPSFKIQFFQQTLA